MLIALHKVGESLLAICLSVAIKDEQNSAAAQPFPVLVKNKAACWDWPVAAECQILFQMFMELSDEGKFIYFAMYITYVV